MTIDSTRWKANKEADFSTGIFFLALFDAIPFHLAYRSLSDTNAPAVRLEIAA